MADKQDDRRYMVPPQGFVIVRENELDPECGRPDRWIARGVANGRSVIRPGMTSHAAACRAAWFAVDDAIALGTDVELAYQVEADMVVSESLARRHAVKRERLANHAAATMPAAVVVPLDDWRHMEAGLLARLLLGAGSIRRLAKVIDVPRSNIGRWIQTHKREGTWPR